MTGTRIPESHGQQRRAWRNLRGTLAPRATLSQLIVGLLCFLLKPALDGIPLPGWLTEPRNRQLPVSDVPRW